MLQLILFAMIGAAIDIGAGYWIVYGVSVILWIIMSMFKFIKFLGEKIDN